MGAKDRSMGPKAYGTGFRLRERPSPAISQARSQQEKTPEGQRIDSGVGSGWRLAHSAFVWRGGAFRFGHPTPPVLPTPQPAFSDATGERPQTALRGRTETGDFSRTIEQKWCCERGRVEN
jgi:hypothetical protein